MIKRDVMILALIFMLGFGLYPLFTRLGQSRSEMSGITGMATSQVGNISAGIATFLSCSWSNDALNISFGSNLNPGTNDTNATGNYLDATTTGTAYNVTVDTLSNTQANISMKGENLTSGANKIGLMNVSWASNTTISNSSNMAPTLSTRLNNSFDTANWLAANEAIGSTVHYRFWLDIPNGTVAGSYVGNYTQQCQAAS